MKIIICLAILAVQNERQPRNSAQVRADSIDFHCDGNGTTVSVMHHRPTNSNSASSPGEGSTSSTKQDGNIQLLIKKRIIFFLLFILR